MHSEHPPVRRRSWPSQLGSGDVAMAATSTPPYAAEACRAAPPLGAHRESVWSSRQDCGPLAHFALSRSSPRGAPPRRTHRYERDQDPGVQAPSSRASASHPAACAPNVAAYPTPHSLLIHSLEPTRCAQACDARASPPSARLSHGVAPELKRARTRACSTPAGALRPGRHLPHSLIRLRAPRPPSLATERLGVGPRSRRALAGASLGRGEAQSRRRAWLAPRPRAEASRLRMSRRVPVRSGPCLALGHCMASTVAFLTTPLCNPRGDLVGH